MSTMVDTFIDDTQMLDYQSDLDVPMNAHSSDSWLQEEAIMEEDSHVLSHKQDPHLFFSQKSTTHQSPERGVSHSEMHSIHEAPHLLHSQMHSQSTSVVETTSQNYNATVHLMHDDGQLPHLGTILGLETAEHMHAQTREQKPTVMDTSDGSIEVEMESFPDDEYEMLDGDEELDVEVYDASLVHSSPPREIYSSHSFDESKPQNEPLSAEFAEGAAQESAGESTFFAEQSEVRSLESFSLEKQQGLHFVDTHASASETVTVNEAEVTEDRTVVEGAPGPELDQQPDKTSQVLSVPVEESEEQNVQEGDVNPHYEEETDDHEGSNSLEHEPGVEQADLSALSTGDPHEISEGVYIDPPPAVVLLVAAEAQHHLSLFNEPQEESSGNTQVILQHLPTLYYEPLYSVFEAFRQDQLIHTLLDTNNAELTLDAYELQLTVSEDNFYAREVTLHDLNILHDAAGINGPLRLRLTAASPRFIVHYRRLQERVSSLAQGEVIDALSLTVVEEHNKDTNHLHPSTSLHSDEALKDHVNQLEEGEHQGENITRIQTPKQQEGVEQSTLSNNSTDPVILSNSPERYSDVERNAAEKDPTVANSLGDNNNKSEGHEDEDGHGEGAGDGDSSGEVGEEEYTRAASLSLEENTPQNGNDDEPNESGTEDGHGHPGPEQNNASGELVTFDDELENSEGVEAYEESSELHNLPFPTDSTDDQALFVGQDDWDDSLDGEGELDTTWDIEQEQDLASNGSSNTLSSKASKRGFDEVDPDFGDDVEDASPPSSPDPKRLRVQ